MCLKLIKKTSYYASRYRSTHFSYSYTIEALQLHYIHDTTLLLHYIWMTFIPLQGHQGEAHSCTCVLLYMKYLLYINTYTVNLSIGLYSTAFKQHKRYYCTHCMYINYTEPATSTTHNELKSLKSHTHCHAN